MIPEAKKEFCMYLGPNIPGVIQTARVFRGSKHEVCQELADTIEKYPGVKELIISGSRLAEDRVKIATPGTKIATPGTLLNDAYIKLAKSVMSAKAGAKKKAR